MSVEIQMTVAFISVRGVWQNTTQLKCPCVFELPTPGRGTVTAATVHLQGGQGYRTAVVDSNALAAEVKRGSIKENERLESSLDYYMRIVSNGFNKGEFDPDVFRLPFTDVPPGAQATVNVSYFQQLAYGERQYKLEVPLVFAPQSVMAPTLQQALTLDVVVNTGTEQCRHVGASHPLVVVEQEGVQHMVMKSNNQQAFTNKDFMLAYEVTSPSILSNLLVQPRPDGDGYASLLGVRTDDSGEPYNCRELVRTAATSVFSWHRLSARTRCCPRSHGASCSSWTTAAACMAGP